MAGFLDNAEIDVPCPNCGKKIKQKLGGLKNSPTIRCPGCGSSIKLDASGPKGAAKSLQQVEKGIDDLRRTLRKLGK